MTCPKIQSFMLGVLATCGLLSVIAYIVAENSAAERVEEALNETAPKDVLEAQEQTKDFNETFWLDIQTRLDRIEEEISK